MTKVDTTANHVYSTDAGFRAWGTVINASFLAAGLTQTADTGQINWTTVTKPTAIQTVAGYEIYRFNDTLQATAPIFIKVVYASAGQASGNNSILMVQIGQGSNGSGTLTGATTITTTTVTDTNASGIYATATADTISQPVKMCYLPGYFMCYIGSYVAASPDIYPTSFFLIARTINTSGALTGDGVYLYRAANGALTPMNGRQQTINFSTNAVMNASLANPNVDFISDVATTMDTMNKTYVLPHYALLPQPFLVTGIVNYKAVVGPGYQMNVSLAGETAVNYMSITRNFAYPFYPEYAFNGATNQNAYLTNEQTFNELMVMWA